MNNRYSHPYSILCTLLLSLCLTACDSEKENSNKLIENTGLPVSGITSNPNDFESVSALADSYFEAAQYPQAINMYNRALAINPNCADCLNDRGLAEFYTGDADSALISLNQATLVDPGFTHAWLSKGFVLSSLGRNEEAIAPLNKVKELDGTGILGQEADRFLSNLSK